MRVRIFFAVIAAFFMFGALAPSADAQSAAGLGGEWRGTYSGDGNAPTEFEVDLTQNGRSLTGAMIERSAQPQNGYYWLLSRVSGSVLDANVSFTKTYVDPNAGWTHTVSYQGTLSDNGRRIRGTWSLDGAQGQFEMVR